MKRSRFIFLSVIFALVFAIQAVSQESPQEISEQASPDISVARSFIFPLPEGKGSLKIHNLVGDVSVRPWDLSSMKVAVQIVRKFPGPIKKNGTPLLSVVEQRAELEKIFSVKKKVSASQVELETKINEIMARFAGFLNQRNAFAVNYVVDLPSQTSVTIDSLDGEVSVKGIHSGVNITSLGGKVDIRGVDGRVSIDMARGDVRVWNSQGRIKISQLSGHLEVSDYLGLLNLNLDRGTLVLKDVSGTVGVRSASANIEASRVIGSSSIHSYSGQVVCSECRGRVKVDSVRGTLFFSATQRDWSDWVRLVYPQPVEMLGALRIGLDAAIFKEGGQEEFSLKTKSANMELQLPRKWFPRIERGVASMSRAFELIDVSPGKGKLTTNLDESYLHAIEGQKGELKKSKLHLASETGNILLNVADTRYENK